MNREMRRLQAKEEERAKKRRAAAPQRQKKERTPISQFMREVRQELKKVAWPSREETTTFSVVVLIVTVFVTAMTFGLDIGLKRLVLSFFGAG
ncbi:MAG: preprotein translocase subunit SecE [Acidimicrobiia bacterium]|nr:preprotein translocase subunit SecE [Acidimicrobiia bacterium]